MDLVGLICEIILAVGAITAIVSFFGEKRKNRRTAATILIHQIDQIEVGLRKFNECATKNPSLMPNEEIFAIQLFSCDEWDKSKHLLIKNSAQKTWK